MKRTRIWIQGSIFDFAICDRISPYVRYPLIASPVGKILGNFTLVRPNNARKYVTFPFSADCASNNTAQPSNCRYTTMGTASLSTPGMQRWRRSYCLLYGHVTRKKPLEIDRAQKRLIGGW